MTETLLKGVHVCIVRLISMLWGRSLGIRLRMPVMDKISIGYIPSNKLFDVSDRDIISTIINKFNFQRR